MVLVRDIGEELRGLWDLVPESSHVCPQSCDLGILKHELSGGVMAHERTTRLLQADVHTPIFEQAHQPGIYHAPSLRSLEELR